jgi:hypothetical protein
MKLNVSEDVLNFGDFFLLDKWKLKIKDSCDKSRYSDSTKHYIYSITCKLSRWPPFASSNIGQNTNFYF